MTENALHVPHAQPQVKGDEGMGRTRRDFLKTSAIGAGAAAGILTFPMVSRAQAKKLTVWRDLLKEAGLPDDPDKIPMKWDEYWAFWKRAQDNLRKKDPAKYTKVYGIGMTESPTATDTIWNFEMALLSYGGQVFSDDGKVIADQPKNRRAIVAALKFFAGLFSSGYVPPDALNWSDGDNNANFHSKSIVMTPNPSLSIPAYHYFETPDNYFNKSATIEWPDGPDGRKPTYMIAVKPSIIPKHSAN